MMKPQTTSEQMLYSTVRLEASNGSTGTGFFFNFKFAENKNVPVIITNKHVVNGNENESVKFFLHTKEGDAPADEKINITFQTKWYFHPSQDLCFCFINPLFEQVRSQKSKEVFYIPVDENLIWDDEKLQGLSAIEDVVMVGYPTGLWDKKNNLPLFRRGITSSHPAIDFNDKSIGVVDMACFPGSSGSSIFVLNENGYSDKNGNVHLGGKRVVFLGVLFQGPQLNAKGELIIQDIPTQQKVSAVTPMMIHLGYYIKGEEILTFKAKIEKLTS
ncbi:MAG: serine protease [Candidatus Paceibacterota bacterium]